MEVKQNNISNNLTHSNIQNPSENINIEKDP